MDPFFLLIGAVVGCISLWNWRFAFLGLLLFTPFNGGIAIAFSSPFAILMKDFLFTIPLYISLIGVFLKLHPHSRPAKQVFHYALAFIGIVLINFLLSNLNSNFLSGLIGMKVWLFYLPLIPITCLYLQSTEDLAFLQRCLAIVGIIVCAIGLYQFVGAFILGNQPPIFGTLPGQLFGGFRQFHPGGGRFRFPATFANSNLFGASCVFQGLLMLPAALHEPQRMWKWLYYGSFFSACIGTFACGQLTMWVMFPFLLVLFAAWTHRLGSIFWPLLAVGGVLYAAQQFAAKGLTGQFDALQTRLPQQQALGQNALGFALEHAPFLGQGLGTATVQARYGRTTDPLSTASQGVDGAGLFESYPAKVVFELGGMGAVVTYTFYIACWYCGWTIQKKLHQSLFQDLAKAVLLIMALIFLYPNGNWLDPDPLNVYYWVLIGMLLALPRLDREVTHAHWYSHPSLATSHLRGWRPYPEVN